jgi:hypothetical protein
MSDLSQACGLAKKVTRLDFICAAAMDLGEHLARAGAKDEARPLLIEARDGYLKLGRPQAAAEIDALLQRITDDGETGA